MEVVIIVLLSRAGWQASSINEESNNVPKDNSRTNDGYEDESKGHKKTVQMGYAHQQSQDTVEQVPAQEYQEVESVD